MSVPIFAVGSRIRLRDDVVEIRGNRDPQRLRTNTQGVVVWANETSTCIRLRRHWPLRALEFVVPTDSLDQVSADFIAAQIFVAEDMRFGEPKRHEFLRSGKMIGAIAALGAILVMVGAGILLTAPPDMSADTVVLPTGAAQTMPPLLTSFPTLDPTVIPSMSVSVDPIITIAPTSTPIVHSATRIVMTKARVDLPVITAPTNEKFPYCDVAERMAYYGEPGAGEVTYLYAHSTHYMFGGLLAASWRSDSYLLGTKIQIYTSDDLVYTYAVTEIHRNVPWTSFAIVNGLVGEALVLQACENNDATGPKLIVVARPVSVAPTSHSAAHPHTAPRVCAHGY
jgi:hypothetical protein